MAFNFQSFQVAFMPAFHRHRTNSRYLCVAHHCPGHVPWPERPRI